MAVWGEDSYYEMIRGDVRDEMFGISTTLGLLRRFIAWQPDDADQIRSLIGTHFSARTPGRSSDNRARFDADNDLIFALVRNQACCAANALG
jgi:hypothetical protein